jgi:hypothetical protein
MDKYITIPDNFRFPEEIESNNNYTWWVPEELPLVIEMLEKYKPDYEFVQVITSPGNGGYPSFFLMKLK